MATADVASPVPIPSIKSRPIISDKLKASSELKRKDFDPERHLSYVTDPKILSMKDIALPEDVGISPVAVSDPFPLFSEDAIRHMRSEIFTQEVWDNCVYSTDFAGCQLRGHCPK